MQRQRKPKNFLPKPIYHGGPKAMGIFISKNLLYPPTALKNSIDGTVVLRLQIDYTGRVTGAKVKSGLGHGCDEEAQRVVKLLKFGIANKVRKGKILFHKTVNIHFRLPKPKKKVKTPPTTQINYNITSSKSKKQSSSYNYTINIG